ncbi:hypothetical protein UO65_3808 [Actinokineospora spheciospongiae]|uniref:Uncharacterized protein n=1 Tax=Actinokineospora spheciospongiae TaxID=909613 RepID=W7IKL4_9PSEU|nr:hypothetical protein UO65_3808 [Actinokineospora spheciospongiae]
MFTLPRSWRESACAGFPQAAHRGSPDHPIQVMAQHFPLVAVRGSFDCTRVPEGIWWKRIRSCGGRETGSTADVVATGGTGHRSSCAKNRRNSGSGGAPES